MNDKVKATATVVKSGYKFANEAINWYPGHMKKATERIEEQLSRINLFLEVVDARAPISSRNSAIESLLPKKVKRLVVMNKADLAIKDTTKKFIEYYRSQKINSIAINANDKTGAGGQKLLSVIRKLAAPQFKSIGSWLMIGGIPNVGKSTIINSLRKTSKSILGKTKSAKVGPTPGVTRGVSGFKICMNPLLYLIDTPGVMPMKIESTEMGYKLLLCSCIRDGLVPNLYLSDYLLYLLNEKDITDYVKLYGLGKKSESIEEVLDAIKKKFQRKEEIEAADLMVKHFREGDLGKITLDDVPSI